MQAAIQFRTLPPLQLRKLVKLPLTASVEYRFRILSNTLNSAYELDSRGVKKLTNLLSVLKGEKSITQHRFLFDLL